MFCGAHLRLRSVSAGEIRRWLQRRLPLVLRLYHLLLHLLLLQLLLALLVLLSRHLMVSSLRQTTPCFNTKPCTPQRQNNLCRQA